MIQQNSVLLTGQFEAVPVFSHRSGDESFYKGVFCVKRLSGAMDRLPVILSGSVMGRPEAWEGPLQITGRMRSYDLTDGSAHLWVTVFAQGLAPHEDDQTVNEVRLTGDLCKMPIYRTTPFGRQICDMMLAVHRKYGKCDYIPCIAWGRTARYASRLRVGDRVTVTGRFQSRAYQKTLEDGQTLPGTSYEVSCFTLRRVTVADFPIDAVGRDGTMRSADRSRGAILL